ncbi:MAG TPA: hypothetical protein PKE06_27820 [Flavilitoribacter sp.]|nr:hypothetical protein [Flavilitoribacter sp.]HMQ90097.1 hypothetical protein [Flavilitoribacter sp.]
MQTKKLIYILLLSFAVISCRQPGKNTPAEEQSGAGLWEEVMAVHDEVMPKMGELSSLKKDLRNLPQDSLVQAGISELTLAEDAMWDWMHGLKPHDEIEEMGQEEAQTYLEQEKEKISAVKDKMLHSMETAKSLLAETEKPVDHH